MTTSWDKHTGKLSMRKKCARTAYWLHLSPLPSIAKEIKFLTSEKITHLERFEKITVHSRKKIPMSPSSTLTTSRCLVAIVKTKMKTNALWKTDSFAILQKHQVDMHVLQSIQTVDCAFVGRVALEG